MSAESIDQLSINTIRTLSMDAVQAANSGHPGTPMGMAPVAYTIWQNHLRFDPKDPLWPDRDRFILSAGHASMLLYSLLYLTEVQAVNDKYEVLNEPSVPLEQIKRFRQLGSRTPGHPEYHHTTGVETTTGPLGQGAATSVGMAIAERWLAHTYNRPGYDLFDHKFYVITGDGDNMEGVSGEAASLAGHLKLANLCWIYDSTASRSRARPVSPSPRTPPRASRPMAGTSTACPTPTTRPRSARRSRASRSGPTSRPSSSSARISATAPRPSRIAGRPTARRWARTRSRRPSASTAGRKTPSSMCRTA